MAKKTDLTEILAKIVERDESLKSVVLSDCKVQPGQMELLFGEHSLLESINFDNVQIPDYVCEAIAKHLQTNKNLKTLKFHYSGFQTQGAIQIAKCLRNPECHVEELEIVGCNIMAKGAQAFAEALSDKNCKLTVLRLNETSAGDEGCKAIFLALLDNDRLRTLSLDWNMITGDSGPAMYSALTSNRSVEDLSLAYNSISAMYLADALPQNKTLRRLNILGNKIGDDGAKALKPGLEANTTLRAINLYLCGVQTEGVNCLLQALEVNSTLETVTIKSNAIAAMLYKNSQISNIVEKRLQAQLKLLFEVVQGLHSKVDVDPDFWEAVKAACEDSQRPSSDEGNPSCLLRALDAGATAAAHLLIKANIFEAVEAAATVHKEIEASASKYESLVNDIQGSLKSVSDDLQACAAPIESDGKSPSSAIAEGRAALQDIQKSIEAVVNKKIEVEREKNAKTNQDEDEGDEDAEDEDEDEDEEKEIVPYPDEIKEAVAHLIEERTKLLETELAKSKKRLEDAQGKSEALEAQRSQYLAIQKQATKILQELAEFAGADDAAEVDNDDLTNPIPEFALLAPSSSDLLPQFFSKYTELEKAFGAQANRALSALKGQSEEAPESKPQDLAPLVVDVLEFGAEASEYLDGRLSRAAKKYRSRCQASLDEVQSHLCNLSAVETEHNARDERLWCDFLEKLLDPTTFSEVEEVLEEALDLNEELNCDTVNLRTNELVFDLGGKKTKATAQKMKQQMEKTKLQMRKKRHMLRTATARAHSGITTFFPELKFQDALHLTGKHCADLPARDIVEYSNLEILDSGQPNVKKAIVSEGDGHERPVVLKMFDLKTPQGVKGFENELKIRKDVQHRNILPVTAVVEDRDSSVYLEMPFCVHGNLEQWLATERTEAEKFKVALQVVLALEAIHAKQHIHRDLSLRNILVDRREHVYVGDLEVSGPKNVNTVKFEPRTKLYSAPELEKPGSKASQASDIYSLGCVLFDIFFGIDKRSEPGEWKIPYHKNKHLRPLLTSLTNSSAHARPSIDVVRSHLFFTPDLADSDVDPATVEGLLGPLDAGWKFQDADLKWEKENALEDPCASEFFPVVPGSKAFGLVTELVEGAGGSHNRLDEQSETLMQAILVRNNSHEAAFYSTMGNLALRYNEDSPFVISPNWSKSDKRNVEVMDHFFKTGGYNQIPLPSGIKGLHIMTVFHGTKNLDQAKQICRSGFAVVEKANTTTSSTSDHHDKGWYGQGLYFTLDLKYALKYYGDTIVVCNIVFGNPFPATRLMNGAAMQRNHDSHIVVVDHNGRPATQSANPKYTEIVLGEAAQIVPRAILKF